MSRILRFFVCLGTLFFAGNALAAGYTCSSLPKYVSCQAGYYMTSSSSSTTYNGTPKTGNYCQPCSRMGSNYTCAGGTAAPQQSAGGYSCPTYKKYTSCSSGYYMTTSSTSSTYNGTPKAGNACRPCSVYGSNYTCAGGTAAPQPITINVTCQAGQYLAKGATSCTTCPAGSYCPGGTFTSISLVAGATSDRGKTTCPSAYSNSATGSSSINDCYLTLNDGEMVDIVNMGSQFCNEGYYCNHGGQKIYYDENGDERGLTDSRPTIGGYEACARGSYTADYEATACEACTNGKTTSGTGSTSCDATCSNSANVATWNTATWQENYVSSHCSIKTCVSGYKLENNKCVLSSVTCAAGQYLPKGATSCVTCPVGYKCPSSSKTYTVSTTTDQGNTACSGSTEYQDTTGQTSCKTPSDGYYKKDNTSQQPCGTGYFCKSGVRTACTTYGTGYTTDTTTASVNTQCYLNVAGGKVRNGTTGTTLNTCVAGTYKAAHKAYYGTSYSCDSCTGRTKYSAAGASSCSTVSSGYYTTGCNSSNNNCTGQSQCTGATYCTSGVRNSCPTAESGWTLGTGTGWTSYTSCYETKAATSVSSYCSAGQLKKNAASATAWGTATISTAFQAKGGSIVNGQTCTLCSSGTYSAGGTATSCSSCDSAYPYSDAGASSAGSCYKNGTKTGSQVNGSVPTNCYSVTSWNSCTPGTCTYRIYKSGTATSCTPTNCTKTPAAVTAKTGYRTNGTSCTACPSGYPNSDAGNSGGITSCYSNSKSRAWTGSQVNGSVPTNCNSVTSWNSCSVAACSYVAYSNSSGNGDGTIKSGCSTNSADCTKTPAAVTAKSGYRTNGTSCTACPSGYPNSAAGNTGGITACYSNSKDRAWTGSQVNGTVPTNCNSVSSWNACSLPACSYVAYSNSTGNGDGTIKSGCSTNNANCTKTVAAVTAKSGYYVSGTSCTACSGLASGMYPNSDNGNTGGMSACRTNSLSGQVIAKANASSATQCEAGTFKAAHTVNYGSTSSCGVCGTSTYSDDGAAACTACATANGYTNSGTTAASHAGVASCKTTCAAGTYVATAGTACTTVDVGYWGAGGTVSQNATLGRTQCPANYRNGAAASAESGCQTSCAAGTYVATAKAACTTVGTGYYRAAHSVNYGATSTRSQCPENYRSGAATGAESSCQTSCAGGTYVATAKAACTTVGTGYYRAAHSVNYGSTSTRTQCPAGYRDGAATGAESSCAMSVAGGKYVAKANESAASGTCAAGTYKAAHSVYYGSTSSCSVCATSTYSDAGAAACTACATANGYTNSGTTAASHAGVASCKTTCSGTQYVATAGTACVTVGTGYYGRTAASTSVAQNATLARTKCPSIYVNGAAATQESDCAVQTTAGKYIAAAKDTEQTKCPAKSYCPSASVKYGATNSPTACPTADSTTARTTYPTDYLNPTLVSINNQGWSTGLGAITSCSANYSFKNDAGNFSVESVGYNATTGKYDVGGGKYYTLVNKGWYLVDKYSDTYCNTSTNRMYYHNVAECPANSYCPGYLSMPLCSTGTHNDEMGKHECKELGNGYNYSPAKSGESTACYLTTTAGKFVAESKAAESTCTAGGWCAGGTKVNYESTGGRTLCSSLTGVSVSGGTYTSAAGASANTACKYTAPNKTITGCATVTTNTVTYSGTAWPATTYGVTANGGYIISGNNTAAATCSQCQGAVWSAGGTATSCSACPAQTSGWTRNTGNGWSAVTQCNQTQSVGGNCSAGVLKQNATSTTAWGASTISTALQAKPGYIVSGQTCTGCAAGTYSAGGTATSCSACTGRTKYSAANASACSTVSTGYYTTGCNSSSNNCTGQSQCTSGTWCASGVQNQCSSLTGVSVSGGTYTSAAGASANTACKYTAPNKTITGCKTVTTNTVTYSGTAWPATTYGVTANGGYIISGNNTAAATCSQCGTAKYSAGGTATSCSACPTADSGWTAMSPAGSSAYSACYEYQTPANCASGSVKRAASSATAYSSTISLLSTLKSKAGYYASTAATSCTICPAGSSCAASATAPTTCANWTYAASTGMSSCTACPALTSGWAKADSTGTGWKSHTSCVQTSPTPTNCAGGNLKQVAASNGATTWGASAVNSALSSKAGYYVNGTACSACTGATYYGGGTATSCTACPSIYTSNTDAAKSKIEQCQVKTTGGYYIKTAKDATQTECGSGNYCPSTTVAYGSTNTQTACPVPADHKRATIPAEYYASSIAGTSLNTWSKKWAAVTQCQVLNTYEGTRGSLYDYLTYNTTTQKYDVQGGVLWFKANPGYYLTTATGCGTYAYYGKAVECDKNAYCPGKDKVTCNSSNKAEVQVEKFGLELCSALGNGKYATSDGGAAANSTAACYLTTTGQNFVAAAGAAESACTAGGWCPGNVKVAYGSTGGRNTCPTTYPSSAASSNSNLDCYVTTAAGKYVATVGAGQVNCAGTGYYCPGGTNVYSGAYGSRLTTGGRTQCPAGYRDLVATVSTTKEAQCTMNVAGGKFVKVAKESAASGTCDAGYAKAAHSVTYGNTSSCTACTGATYAASTGQASCTACPTAKTYASAVQSYGYWNNGKDGDHTISGGCYVTMSGTLSNGSLTYHGCYLGTDGDYGNGGGKRCYVHQDNLKCNAGYYASTLSNGYVWNNTRAGLLSDTCVGVGAGYYSAANVLTRSQCPTGLTTIGYGAGADEVTDCGRILHFGDDKLYLRSGKKTTPSLNVKIGDTTYYGNMTAGTGKGKLRLKSGSTTYSVHDDSM